MSKSTRPQDSKNITVDGDLVELIRQAKPKFVAVFHFEPTTSQLIRYLLTEAVAKLGQEDTQ